MAIVTIEDLEIAISKTLGVDMSQEDIKLLAEHIMSFFGFREVIIDNKLTSKDRDLFYKMENHRLLKTDNEETTLKKGKRWRQASTTWSTIFVKVSYQLSRSEIQMLSS